ncbi:hypothetical protein AVEN_134789-1 [Araneus ventricosus]|uniref:Uncharacterized protein n=1 Tax=Araneus ventricosus TaxID=182803 RepID=A0A4Y2GC93_ARAVE|nr:hypothetical protein AVEN_134789-1 [Araneus ventricosus]
MASRSSGRRKTYKYIFEPTSTFHSLHLSICFPELLPLLNLTAESRLCNSGYFPVIVSHDDSGGEIQYPPRYLFQRADCTNFTQMADITESMVGQYTKYMQTLWKQNKMQLIVY